MISFFCLACLAGLLVIGALIDIECRRLPNWLTSAVAFLYGLFVAVSPTPVAWISALAVAAMVFAVGFAFFAFQFMGGGDVKLLAGLALWAGVDHFALFLIATSLAGGLLAVAMLVLRRCARSPLLMFLPLSAPIGKRFIRPTAIITAHTSADLAKVEADVSLPYGVAIAAGGLVVIYSLLQL